MKTVCSAWLSFRLSVYGHTSNITFPGRDASKKSLGTAQHTQNTQNAKSIHKNSTQREEMQFAASLLFPTAKHTTAHRCFALFPIYVCSFVPNMRQSTPHVDFVLTRSVVMTPEGKNKYGLVLQSPINTDQRGKG